MLTFEEALEDMERRGFDFKLVPYENQEGMAATKRIFDSLKPGMSVAVMIGAGGAVSTRWRLKRHRKQGQSQSAWADGFCGRKPRR